MVLKSRLLLMIIIHIQFVLIHTYSLHASAFCFCIVEFFRGKGTSIRLYKNKHVLFIDS